MKQKLFFGKNIKYLRRHKRITQEEFAEEIGTTRVSVVNWEKGIRVPQDSTIKTISSKYGIGKPELLYEDIEAKKILPREARTIFIHPAIGTEPLYGISYPLNADFGLEHENTVLFLKKIDPDILIEQNCYIELKDQKLVGEVSFDGFKYTFKNQTIPKKTVKSIHLITAVLTF